MKKEKKAEITQFLVCAYGCGGGGCGHFGGRVLGEQGSSSLSYLLTFSTQWV